MRGAEQPDGFSASNCQSIAGGGGGSDGWGGGPFFSCAMQIEHRGKYMCTRKLTPLSSVGVCLCMHVNVSELLRLSWSEIAHGLKWQRFSQQRYAEQIIANFSIDFGVGEGGKEVKKGRKYIWGQLLYVAISTGNLVWASHDKHPVYMGQDPPEQATEVKYLRFLSNIIMLHESNNGGEEKSHKIWLCFSYEFHRWWIYPTAGTRWMKPARTHLCWISIQCSNAFLKVGAINRLIIRTVENILIRGKSLSEIVLST